MRVRLGSARTTDSGTTSSHTTITRRAAKAASFWQPSSPHTWASPSAVARCTWMMATSGLSGRHGVHRLPVVRPGHGDDAGVGRRQVAAGVGAQREEGEAGRPGGVAADHPEVAVLLDLEGRRVGVLDAPPDGVQRPRPRVAHPREHQAGDDPGGHQLVADHVGGEPAQGEVAPSLPDQLVPGGVADEMGEALDRHGVAVGDQPADGLAHGGDLAHPSPSSDCHQSNASTLAKGPTPPAGSDPQPPPAVGAQAGVEAALPPDSTVPMGYAGRRADSGGWSR